MNLYIVSASGIKPDDGKAWELATELVLLELELLETATAIRMTRLIRITKINNLTTLLEALPAKKG